MKKNILFLLLTLSGLIAVCQPANVIKNNRKTIHITLIQPSAIVHPLDKMVIVCQPAGTVSITDSKGTEYLNMQVTDQQEFLVGGAAGVQTARLFDSKGNLLGSSSFRMEAQTNISDGGKTSELFNLLYNGMLVYSPTGYEEVTWNGKTYRYFVNWVLDNNNTTRGMQYFSPYSRARAPF